MAEKKFMIERQDDGSWVEANDPGSGAVMSLDVSWVEEKLHDHYKRYNTVIGGISPKEFIKRLVLCEDGTIKVHIGRKHD